MMKKVNWLVDAKVFSKPEELAAFVSAATTCKIPLNLILTKYVPFDDTNYLNLVGSDDPTVVYGTIEFARNVQRSIKESQRANIFTFGLTPDIECLQYYPRLPTQTLLNEDVIFLPFNMFKADAKRIFEMFNTDTLFIRPNSGFKTFTGTTISKGSFDYDVSCLEQLSGITDYTLCLISNVKDIVAEYRFVICNSQVIHSAMYSEAGVNFYDVFPSMDNSFIPDCCLELVNKIAAWPWQADVAYVCDIAQLRSSEAKILEFNAFACAGMYTLNYKRIIERLSEAAILTAEGEITLLR